MEFPNHFFEISAHIKSNLIVAHAHINTTTTYHDRSRAARLSQAQDADTTHYLSNVSSSLFVTRCLLLISCHLLSTACGTTYQKHR
jgi:hypothetical protein